MKKILILLLLIVPVFYACTNKLDINENSKFKTEEKGKVGEQGVKDDDDTTILKASPKENDIDIHDLTRKVQEDLNAKGFSSIIIDRSGNSLYIMTTESEIKDIRIHKINIDNTNEFNIHKYINDHRNDNYETLGNILRKEEYLIIPANIKGKIPEEAISWVTNDGAIKIYEISEGETYQE